MKKVSSGSDEIRIDEIVGLLYRIRPQALEELRLDLPEAAVVLKVGQVMGTIPNSSLLKATQRSLAEIVPWGEQAIDSCRRSLGNARRLELGGSVVALVSSGSCAILAAFDQPAKVILSAVLAVVGNICVGLGSYYRSSLMGGKHSLEEAYTVLLRSMPELKVVQSQISELAAHTDSGVMNAETKRLIARAQLLCKQVYEASKKVP